MAKKEKMEEKEAKLEEPMIPPESAQDDLGYSVGKWRGMDQYCCKHCEFDTLELKVIEEHLMFVHGRFKIKEPVAPASTALLNTTAPLSVEDVEVADGVFEIDLKEDQNGKTIID